MLQACLNGGRVHPGVPVTPAEIAAAAVAARAAGAAEFHVHPRDAAGNESLGPEDVAACLRAVRAAVPGAPVGIGTGAWIAPCGRDRHALVSRWIVLPDYASVNLNEEDAPDLIALLRKMGVGIEAGLWNADDARRFTREIDPSDCLRILIEMPDVPDAEALAEADATLRVLADAGVELPVLLHGIDRSTWACLARAAELGLDSRIGFEDVTVLPDGTPATDNAALVRAAAAIMGAGRS